MKKLLFVTTIMLGIAVTVSAQKNDAKTTKVESEKEAITKNRQAEIEKAKINAEKENKAKAKQKQTKATKSEEIVVNAPAALTREGGRKRPVSATAVNVKQKTVAKKKPAKQEKSAAK